MRLGIGSEAERVSVLPVHLRDEPHLVRHDHGDVEFIGQGHQLLTLPELVGPQGHRAGLQRVLHPREEVAQDLLLGGKREPRLPVGGLDHEGLAVLGLAGPAGGTAAWIEVAGKQQVVHPDHGGSKDVPRLREGDVHPLHLHLLVIGQGRPVRLLPHAYLHHIEGLGGHVGPRRQMVHVGVANDRVGLT